jgi:xanthine/CO dehydrogenase XdhC/CoxF family maturation factor
LAAIFGAHTDKLLKVPVEDIGVLLDVDTRAGLERFQQAYTQANWGSALLESVDLEGRGLAGPQLVIVGEDAVAKALAQFGSANLPASAETYVVVASRGRFDEEAVEQALGAGARYVAQVANKRRAQEILDRLRAKGLSDEQLARRRAPPQPVSRLLSPPTFPIRRMR